MYAFFRRLPFPRPQNSKRKKKPNRFADRNLRIRTLPDRLRLNAAQSRPNGPPTRTIPEFNERGTRTIASSHHSPDGKQVLISGFAIG